MNKITILNHKVCKIELENSDILENLRAELSFKMTGIEFIPAYRNGSWDGITKMLNYKNEFPGGLLPRVKEFLKNKNLIFETQDLRKPIEKMDPINIDDNLKKLSLVPRDYQEKMADVISKDTRGIIRACTGSGKSLVAAMMAAKLGKPTCIFVISLDLLEQFHKFFSKVFNEPIGYIGNGVCEVQRINIASIWTVARSLSLDLKDILIDEEVDQEEEYNPSDKEKILTCLNDTKVFLLDECHVCSTNTIKSIYKVINPEYLYGLSGTPFREDGSNLMIEGILGKVLIDVPASQLIAKGYLIQPLIKFVNVPFKKISGHYQQIYKEYIVENEERNNLIVDNVKILQNLNYKIFVLFKQIKHGDILRDLFQENNLSFGYLSGKDSTDIREEVKENFLSGKYNIILASTIFDIGVDVPIANALVLAGGGKSEIRARQRIGRVIRPAPKKKYVAVVDFYDQVKYLKKHSQRRHEIYQSENGFRVVPEKLESKKS
jgi:superfamily II DNA or RNA helicase